MKFNQIIKIKNKFVKKNRCFVVAEISANHSGNFNNMRKLIYDLKKINVDAIKIQAYEADTITLNSSRRDFRCQKLCHFYKNKWPGTNTTMCEYVEKRLYSIGHDETVKECTKEGFNIGYYEAPG